MLKLCSVTFAAVMFAAVLADVLVLSVVAVAAVLDAVTVWNAVLELSAEFAAAYPYVSISSIS